MVMGFVQSARADTLLAILRSSSFMRPDGTGLILLELHRYQRTHSTGVQGGPGVRKFFVTTRIPAMKHIDREEFDTPELAKAYWDEQAHFREDQGFLRLDREIEGWHEEG